MAERAGKHPQPVEALEWGRVVEALPAERADHPLRNSIHRKAKDLLRASRLLVLPDDNPHVASDLKKVRQGDPLSPVLLARGRLGGDFLPTIADG